MIQKDKIHAISEFCERYDILDYKINVDGSIDVDGGASLFLCSMTEIPFKFNRVSGNFNCSFNDLTSLKNCPNEVGGDFECYQNKLSSLDHSPSVVIGSYHCYGNKLTSLIGCPIKVGGEFNCANNKLSTLRYCPNIVGGEFNCTNNIIRTLKFSPSRVGNNFNCTDNCIQSFTNFTTDLVGEFFFANNPLSRLFGDLNTDGLNAVLKYHSYYDVWTPELNDENLSNLLEDIKDGLR
jgi:hypothetical protein